jgi:cellulose synthase/poly-beta-1,6-N-acetylglucosamine synthase-like glycosyltransferase
MSHSEKVPEQRSAAKLFSFGQKMLLLVSALCIGVVTLVGGPLALLRWTTGAVIVFYLVFVTFKLLVWAAAKHSTSYAFYDRIAEVADDLLPTVTILVPMHDEANMVAPLIEALLRLLYPARKLQVLFLLEEDDKSTRSVVHAANLPSHISVLIVPNIGPRTKPKACNFGYMHARGDLVVIFDAEDRPEYNQLRFVAKMFAYYQSRARTATIGCLQARLVFWNPASSLISACYAGEYGVHFYLMLDGLARLDLIPPLGGTSNHFLREALDAIAKANGPWVFTDERGNRHTMIGPWDPYNLTEDADMAFRLKMSGWETKMIPVATYEEAPANLLVALWQRSRWFQGYIQTALVQLRRPVQTIRKVGFIRWFCFHLFILGTPLSALLNPLTWATTILYILSRVFVWESVTTFMEALFPGPIYYIGMFVAVFGNGLLFYQKLMTALKRQQINEEHPVAVEENPLVAHLQENEYGQVLRLIVSTAAWWGVTPASAYIAVTKLTIPSLRFHWSKTGHGHDNQLESNLQQQLTTETTPSSVALLERPQDEREGA